MAIDGEMEGGNIEVLGSSGGGAELAIRADSNADFRQWFQFRATGAAGKRSELRILNAGESTYPDAWEDYRACASYDQQRWFRVPTTFDGTTLTIDHHPHEDIVTYAYFAPFTLERQNALLTRAARSRGVKIQTIAKSVQGRDVDVAIIGEPERHRRRIWITARQHPGETMAEWFAAGMLERLLTRTDPIIRELTERAVLYIVPNMNPDGSVLGNLRANAAGMNLNRAWLEPDAETSPEVLGVREFMHATGVDLFLDIHGDERNPYCFLAGCEGNPGYSERIRDLENLFEQSLVAFDDDFQDEYGYDRDEPGAGDLSSAANYVGETFDCLSYTLEMPFKDAENNPDATRGWTPERASRLGRAALDSVCVCLESLR